MLSKEQLEYIDAKIATKNNVNPLDRSKDFGHGFIAPIDNGNFWGVELYKAMYEGFDVDAYNWLLVFQRYYTNLWTIKTPDSQAKYAFKMCLATGFWFGCFGLYKAKDKFIAYGLLPREVDENQEIIKADLWINNQTFMGIGEFNKEGITTSDAETAFGKFNFNGLPMLIHVKTLIQRMVKMDKAFNTNIVWNAKKVIFEQNNNSSIILREEIASIFDPEVPVIIRKGMTMGNKEVENEVRELSNKETQNDLIQQIKGYFGFMARLIGVYEHSNFKRERNISNEFEGDELIVRLMLEEINFELTRFVEKCNKLNGTNWELQCKLDEWLDDDEGKESEVEESEVENDSENAI